MRLTRFAASKLLLAGSKEEADARALELLAVRSLLEDGDFVRTLYKEVAAGWFAKFEDSLKAAVKAGDADRVPSGEETAPLFANALRLGLMLYLRPRKPVVAVRASRERIVERCVWFILLGAGVKAEAIRRHYGAPGLEG